VKLLALLSAVVLAVRLLHKETAELVQCLVVLQEVQLALLLGEK
jgi:hypothetical protein